MEFPEQLTRSNEDRGLCHTGSQEHRGRIFDTFIFDLDGTLLDTLPDLVTLTNIALEQEGFPKRTEQEILSYVGSGVKALVYKAVPPDATEQQVEGVMKRWETLYPLYGSRLTREFSGMTQLLLELTRRKKKIGVLSNKFEQGVLQLTDEHFPDLISVAHGESCRIPRKPDPRGLLYTIEEMGSQAEQVVYIGDSPNDITTAHRIEVFAIGVTWGYHDEESLLEAGADAIARTVADILTFA